MAGDWIKFELSTSDKPEVWQIAASLDLDPDAVVGKLLRIWGWFDQQTENGNAPTVTKMLLDRIAGVTGFCDCVVSTGWMHESDSEIYLPNFDRHNGKTAKNRAVTAKRVAKHKAAAPQSNDKSNGVSVTTPLPREEKRREENNSKNICPNSTDPIDVKLISECFERFWSSGIRKDNRKKTLPLFTKILEKQKDPESFTDFIVKDIQGRLLADQLGFDRMLPTTYLNGERWTDQQGSSVQDQCPHEEIIEIYHEQLPQCVGVIPELWRGTQAERDLSSCWRKSETHQDLDYWRWYFSGVGKIRDGYYIGKNEIGRTADLRWLVNPNNFAKTIEQVASLR
ncbi:MAG: hypothetical protein K6L81_01830 [Agarilytica sp.]